MFGTSKKENTIKKYVALLPDTLKKNYGGSGLSDYTEAQVTAAVKKLNLSQEYIQYAILIFCGKDVLIESGKSSDSVLKIINFLGTVGNSGNSGFDSLGSSLLGGLLGDGGDGGGE